VIRYLGFLLEFAIVLLARPIARAHARHRPFVLLASAALAVDVGRHLLGRWRDLIPAGREHPLAGLARALYEADRAAWLLWPAALAAASLRVFVAPGMRLGHVAGAWALAVVALAVTYPASRAPWVLPAAEGAALAVALVAAALWARRREQPLTTRGLLLLWIAAEVGLFVGPFATARPREQWFLAYPLYLARDVVTVAIQAAWLRSLRADEARGG
jgi:hypothetical protein